MWKKYGAFMVLLLAACVAVTFLNYLQDNQEKQSKFLEKPFFFNSSATAEQEQVYNSNASKFTDEFPSSSNPHWTHMPVTYEISNEKECGDYETFAIKYAMSQIENFTSGIVSFRKFNSSSNAKADLVFNCSFIDNCYNKKVDAFPGGFTVTETICAHDLGKTKITNLVENQILNAEIELIGLAGFAEQGGLGKPSGFSLGDCGYPLTEIHEILHAFGYTHRNDTRSIMNPYNVENVGFETYNPEQCKGSMQSIDKEIIDDLMKTYSK